MYNVGSIFRTSDGAGVDKIFLTGYTAYPPRKEISKTAIGAEETVDWEHRKDPVRVIERLRNEENCQIISLEKPPPSSTFKSISYTSFKPDASRPICLILGHEIKGVPKKLLSRSDEIIHIPMHGMKESLNVATAFGVAAYGLVNKFQ